MGEYLRGLFRGMLGLLGGLTKAQIEARMRMAALKEAHTYFGLPR